MTSRVLISKIHCTLSVNQKRARIQCIGITDIELIIQINVSHFHTLVLFPIYSYSQIKRQRWHSHLWKCSPSCCVYSVYCWSLSAPQQGKYQVKTKWILYIKYVTELLSNECRQTKTKPIRNAYSSAISTWVKISNKQALIVSLCL